MAVAGVGWCLGVGTSSGRRASKLTVGRGALGPGYMAQLLPAAEPEKPGRYHVSGPENLGDVRTARCRAGENLRILERVAFRCQPGAGRDVSMASVLTGRYGRRPFPAHHQREMVPR